QRLLAVFGDDRITLGTDYPFTFRDERPAARICEAVIDFAVQEQLLHANARKWLGAV
ncbi:MAG: amidohydrolase family protein, partial [Verrucomicrobia bacterium]|nr:amidohydrolase family protein [Verrucomicrobiota bacterium]